VADLTTILCVPLLLIRPFLTSAARCHSLSFPPMSYATAQCQSCAFSQRNDSYNEYMQIQKTLASKMKVRKGTGKARVGR
jgi:hypothetical protein